MRIRPAPHLQDGHGLREVVLLHGGRGVERGQGVVELLQVAVAEASVVQVVAQTRDQQSLALQKATRRTAVRAGDGGGPRAIPATPASARTRHPPQGSLQLQTL